MRLVEVGKFVPLQCKQCNEYMFMFNLPLVDKDKPGQYVVKKYATCAKCGILYEIKD